MLTERFWHRLLNEIGDGNVIPVIGSRLLTVDPPSFHRRVADKLIEESKIEAIDFTCAKGLEINDTVCRLKASGTVNECDLYADVADAIQEVARELAGHMPRPLVQIAAISDFRLLVTLTSDNLLARALSRRAQVKEIVHAPNLPLSEKTDLDPAWRTRAGEVNLLYLFGKARSNFFAIHEEDILEFAHNLISRGQGVPALFLDEMQSRQLLLIGCNFPDWLSRFFLRLFSKERLAVKKKREWVVDDVNNKSDLIVFLNTFSRDTEMLSDISPAAFVNELYTRWQEQHGAPQKTDEPNRVDRGALFFISYSRQTDASAVQNLYNFLKSIGVAESEIWYDRQSIEPGDDFKQRIFNGIDRCRYFVPLISRAADQLPEKFFRREWRHAIDRKQSMADDVDFFLPLIVDPAYQPQRYHHVPADWVNRCHFGHAPDGIPDEQTKATLQKWVRAARRRLE